MDCVFQSFTPFGPIIAGDCRGLVLSPHCAQYAGLHAHIAATRVLGTARHTALHRVLHCAALRCTVLKLLYAAVLNAAIGCEL